MRKLARSEDQREFSLKIHPCKRFAEQILLNLILRETVKRKRLTLFEHTGAAGQSDAQPLLDKELRGIPEKGDQASDINRSPFVFRLPNRPGDKHPRVRSYASRHFAGSTVV